MKINLKSSWIEKYQEGCWFAHFFCQPNLKFPQFPNYPITQFHFQIFRNFFWTWSKSNKRQFRNSKSSSLQIPATVVGRLPKLFSQIFDIFGDLRIHHYSVRGHQQFWLPSFRIESSGFDGRCSGNGIHILSRWGDLYVHMPFGYCLVMGVTSGVLFVVKRSKKSWRRVDLEMGSKPGENMPRAINDEKTIAESFNVVFDLFIRYPMTPSHRMTETEKKQLIEKNLNFNLNRSTWSFKLEFRMKRETREVEFFNLISTWKVDLLESIIASLGNTGNSNLEILGSSARPIFKLKKCFKLKILIISSWRLPCQKDQGCHSQKLSEQVEALDDLDTCQNFQLENSSSWNSSWKYLVSSPSVSVSQFAQDNKRNDEEPNQKSNSKNHKESPLAISSWIQVENFLNSTWKYIPFRFRIVSFCKITIIFPGIFKMIFNLKFNLKFSTWKLTRRHFRLGKIGRGRIQNKQLSKIESSSTTHQEPTV